MRLCQAETLQLQASCPAQGCHRQQLHSLRHLELLRSSCQWLLKANSATQNLPYHSMVPCQAWHNFFFSPFVEKTVTTRTLRSSYVCRPIICSHCRMSGSELHCSVPRTSCTEGASGTAPAPVALLSSAVMNPLWSAHAQIYNLETAYLQNGQAGGNVIEGEPAFTLVMQGHVLLSWMQSHHAQRKSPLWTCAVFHNALLVRLCLNQTLLPVRPDLLAQSCFIALGGSSVKAMAFTCGPNMHLSTTLSLSY